MDNNFQQQPPVAPAAPASVPAPEHRERRLVLPALLVVLVLGGAYYWYMQRASSPAAPAQEQGLKKDPNVDVANFSQSANAVSAVIDAGMPSWIPVENNSVTESYKAYYKEHKLTQYTLSYVSTKSQAQVWKALADASSKAGFTLDAKAVQAKGQFIANKDGDTLMAVITPRDGGSLVQLNYIDR